MKRSGKLACFIILIGVVVTYWGCENNVSPGVEESFEVVKEVSVIPEAQNATMDLKNGTSKDGYFRVSFDNVEPNNLIKSGMEKDGWCIEWNEGAIMGEQSGVKLYSTKGKKSWDKVNYFLSIKNQLKANDPELTSREIQVVIWSLIENPEFDVDKIGEYSNVSERIYKDGQLLFDVQKVKDIVAKVNSDLSSPRKLKAETTFTVSAVVVENDGQAILVEGDETFWAFGPDEEDYCFREGGSQWGWTYGFGHGDNENHSESTELVAGAGQDMCEATTAEETGGTIVGDLNLEKTGDNLDMTLSAIGDNAFDVVHIDADCDLETLKERIINNGGNVAPGLFPIKYSEEENDEYFKEVTFSLSLSDNELECSEGTLHMAVHGVSVVVVE